MNLTTLPLNQHRLSEQESLGYRVHGTGPATVVLVHGLAARSETWSDLFQLFPASRYTVYLLDLLGSGTSSKPAQADYSIRAHAERLILFLQRQRLNQVTLVGHSLGGAVVLLTAIETMLRGADELLAAAVIMAGPGYIQRLPLMAEIFANRLAAWLFVALYAPDIWIKAGLKMAYYDSSLIDREHIARYAPCYRNKEAKRALVQTCRSLVPVDQEQIVAQYGELRLPVLLLWGNHDHIVPLSQGHRLQEAVPGSKLQILDQCGHNPQEEKPRETYAFISSFIDEVTTNDSLSPTGD